MKGNDNIGSGQDACTASVVCCLLLAYAEHSVRLHESIRHTSHCKRTSRSATRSANYDPSESSEPVEPLLSCVPWHDRQACLTTVLHRACDRRCQVIRGAHREIYDQSASMGRSSASICLNGKDRDMCFLAERAHAHKLRQCLHAKTHTLTCVEIGTQGVGLHSEAEFTETIQTYVDCSAETAWQSSMDERE